MLYYIHGYQSEPDSTKGMLFKEKLNAISIKYRDCKPEELVISDCLLRIKNIIKDDKKVELIGSSLGGFLAAKTALVNPNVKRIFLLNPAIIPPNVDIKKIKDMPQSILSEMQDPGLFNKKIQSDIFILVGTNDAVVSNYWPVEFAKAQQATIMFLKDDHRFTNNLEKLPVIIRSKKH